MVKYRKRAFRRKKRVYRKKKNYVGYRNYKPGRMFRQVSGNPGWNPQYFKIKRTFQYTGPASDSSVPAYKLVDTDFIVVSNVVTTSNTTSYAFKAKTFQVSDIPGITNYGSLFDQYMLSTVVLRFEYMNATEASTESGRSLNVCKVMCWADYDDVSAPTNGINQQGWQDELNTGRGKIRIFPNNRKNTFSMKIKPRILTPVLESNAGITAYSTARQKWLDGSTTYDAKHFGFKFFMQANPVTVAALEHTFRVTATYYVKFRNRK